jgi:coenzyme F420-reducing hydrogenase beta subunit
MAEREVLFTGTPCQVAGLKAFLKKEYGNLLTVDLVCHGVPSPLVWKKYLDEIVDIVCSNAQRIIGIKFRDKIYGWKQLNISIEITSQDNHKSFFVESAEKNSFMRGFLQYIYLRPSCYKCPFKSLKSGSDITIADYWGIQNVLPEFDDDKGISLVMINTEKGKNFYKLLNKNDCETTYAEAFVGNSSIEKSEPLSAKRDVFFRKYLNEPIIQLINRLTADSLQVRIKKKIIVVLRWLGLLSFVKSLLKK